MDAERIKRQAQQILDNFADALASVEKEAKEGKEGHVDREEFERKDGEGIGGNSDFRQALLKNAPAKDDDFIIAETGDWK